MISIIIGNRNEQIKKLSRLKNIKNIYEQLYKSNKYEVPQTFPSRYF